MAMGVSEFLPIITVSEWNANLKKEILSWFFHYSKTNNKPGMVTQVYNSGALEAEAGRLVLSVGPPSLQKEKQGLGMWLSW